MFFISLKCNCCDKIIEVEIEDEKSLSALKKKLLKRAENSRWEKINGEWFCGFCSMLKRNTKVVELSSKSAIESLFNEE